jgi:hypothetical protein
MLSHEYYCLCFRKKVPILIPSLDKWSLLSEVFRRWQSTDGAVVLHFSQLNCTRVYLWMPVTCAGWNALVDTQTGAMDSHGGMDHLRPFLGPATKLSANELVWFTDKTPHEALPQEEDGYHQFFREVTSGIALWFEDHSTLNPK